MGNSFSFKIKGDRGMRYSTFAIVFVIFGFVFCIDSISLFYKFLFAIIFNNLFLQAEVQPKSKHRNNQLTYQYYVCMSKMHQVTTRWRPKIFASKCQVEMSKINKCR